MNDPAVLMMDECEVGAYTLLLCAIWDLEEPGVVPDDDRVLSRLSRTGERWAGYRKRVATAFDTESRPGFWIQKRMVETRLAQDSFVKRQKRNGMRGGRPKRLGLAKTNPSQSPSVSVSGSVSVPVSDTESKTEKRGVKSSAAASRPRFTKPTLAEVQNYARELGKPPECAQDFLNYYESNGWRVGRNPMTSWKHALVRWRGNEWGASANPGPSRAVKIMEFGQLLKAQEASGGQG